jgi:phenylacetate-CoA ligase
MVTAATQLDQLNALLDVVRNGNAFYSRRLKAAGLQAKFSSLSEYFDRISFTTKQELVDDQLANPPYGTNLSYPLARYTRLFQTSGTTRTPMRWLDTPESWSWMLDCWERVYQSAGVTSADRIFYAFSFGPFLGFWTAYESAQRLGCLLMPGGGMRSGTRLRTLLDNDATVLCCTPTYAIRLAEVAAEENVDLSRSQIRRIIVAGEPGGSIPATSAHIERLWRGAKVIDHHGMTEIGPVSYACPKHGCRLHVIESAYIAEVIDPETGRSVDPDGTGELVLTNLGRWGSPILRYRTGDVVRRGADGQCECGTHDLALEGGILGRSDDMLVVRGVNIYPSTVEDLLRSFPAIAEYRVEVHTAQALPELSIQVEFTPGTPAPGLLLQEIERLLTETLGLRLSTYRMPAGSLPRYEMKSSRWVRP